LQKCWSEKRKKIYWRLVTKGTTSIQTVTRFDCMVNAENGRDLTTKLASLSWVTAWLKVTVAQCECVWNHSPLVQLASLFFDVLHSWDCLDGRPDDVLCGVPQYLSLLDTPSHTRMEVSWSVFFILYLLFVALCNVTVPFSPSHWESLTRHTVIVSRTEGLRKEGPASSFLKGGPSLYVQSPLSIEFYPAVTTFFLVYTNTRTFLPSAANNCWIVSRITTRKSS